MAQDRLDLAWFGVDFESLTRYVPFLGSHLHSAPGDAYLGGSQSGIFCLVGLCTYPVLGLEIPYRIYCSPSARLFQLIILVTVSAIDAPGLCLWRRVLALLLDPSQ